MLRYLYPRFVAVGNLIAKRTPIQIKHSCYLHSCKSIYTCNYKHSALNRFSVLQLGLCNKVCLFSTESKNFATMDFEGVKATVESKNALIVDVRNPNELQEHGIIPTSKNIPCKEQNSYYFNVTNFFIFCQCLRFPRLSK